MRKKVLAALLAAAVAGTTVMAGTAVFAAENTEGAKAAGGNITIAETKILRISIHCMLWIRQVLI